MNTRLLNFLLLLVFVSFSAVKIAAQDDMSSMKSEVQKWNEEFSKAMLNGDDEKMLSFYTDDAYDLPSYQPMVIGKDALKKMMMMDKNSGNKMTHFELNSKYIFGSGNLLVDVGTYKFTMEMKNMKKPFKDEGKYLNIFEKQPDGSWKIKADTWNTDHNPWMMMGKNMHKDMDKGMKKDKMK